MYKNYIFDLYGTLVDIHTDEEDSLLWEKASMFYGFLGALYTPKELRITYIKLILEAESNLSETIKYSHESNPEIELLDIFKELFKLKGVDVSDETALHASQMFRITSIDYLKLYDGAVCLLKDLRAKGKNVYLLSNAQRIFTEYELKYLEIYDLFDDIFISSDFGVKKPDNRFYNKLIDKYNINVNESIMIGNDPICDIEGATNVGLHTAYIYSNLSPDNPKKVDSTYYFDHMDLEKLKDTILK